VYKRQILDRAGQVVGEGWHEYELLEHAEVVALKVAAQHAGERLRGGTAYVTLEPCNHTGRTLSLIHISANFDGKEYPVKGSYAYDTVSLKRLGDRSFEETDKLKGNVIEIDTWTVSSDGKTLTVVAVEKPSDRKSTDVMTKAPEKK